MDVRFHERAKRFVDQSMTSKWSQTDKGLRLNFNFVVAKPISRSGMSGMQVALVLNQEIAGLKRLSQNRLDSGNAVLAQGSTR